MLLPDQKPLGHSLCKSVLKNNNGEQCTVTVTVRCSRVYSFIYRLFSFFAQGITAREMAHYFFDIDVRMDWESKYFTTAVIRHDLLIQGAKVVLIIKFY